MQKTKPAANNFDMDFLNSMNRPISGGSKPMQLSNQPAQETTVIDPVAKEPSISEIGEPEAKVPNQPEMLVQANPPVVDDDPIVEPEKNIKATQIVMRVTERERRAMKAYFMKHGVSVSKGIKIAVKYLEEQEKKGLVRFSEVGLY